MSSLRHPGLNLTPSATYIQNTATDSKYGADLITQVTINPDTALQQLRNSNAALSMGAKGVGEEGDKGLGMEFNDPVKAWGMHFDDPRMKPLFAKCAELGMPVSIHVADPIWMYEKMDSTNDGLMNAQTWRIDLTKPGIIGFDALIQTLENVIRDNPKTIFIACHFANLNHEYGKTGSSLRQVPQFLCRYLSQVC